MSKDHKVRRGGREKKQRKCKSDRMKYEDVLLFLPKRNSAVFFYPACATGPVGSPRVELVPFAPEK